MSHITTIKVAIKDLNALKAACRRLGLEFHEGQTSFRAYYVTSDCQHAISVPDARFEVGVKRKGDHYALSWDNWGSGGLEDRLGEGAGKLIQAYTLEAAISEAQRQGMSVWEESLADGSVRLHVQTGE